MSNRNQYFFEGTALKGMGSPHTPHQNIWPLATAVEALTTNSTERKVALLKVSLLPFQKRRVFISVLFQPWTLPMVWQWQYSAAVLAVIKHYKVELCVL